MRAKRNSDLIDQIDEWYQLRCNGTWEHRFGVEIVSCDNPGWLITFRGLPLPAHQIDDFKESLRRVHGAELLIRDSTIELFSRSLRTCLSAAADLIELSGKPNS